MEGGCWEGEVHTVECAAKRPIDGKEPPSRAVGVVEMCISMMRLMKVFFLKVDVGFYFRASEFLPVSL